MSSRVPTRGSLFGLIRAFRSSDSTAQPVRLDKATNTIQTMEYEHHEVHNGNHFFYADSVAIDAAGTQDYFILTPDTTKWAHLTFMATGSLITTVQLYEASDKSGTTEQTVRNNDRNSSTAATTKVYKGTNGGSTDGTLIWQMKSGLATGQSRAGMTTNRENEIILKQNTKYILRITSGSAGNLTNTQLEWYEHENLV